MSRLGKTTFGIAVLSLLLGALLFLNAGSLWARSTADEAPPLFADAVEPTGYEPSDSPSVHRSRLVSVDFDLISTPEANQVLLNLFDDATFVADRHRLAGKKGENLTWVGHIHSVEHGQVTLVIRNGEVMVGNIILPDSIYQVRYLEDGIHLVTQLDDHSLPPHHDPLPVAPPREESGNTLFAAAEGADDGKLIDVMVVYTPAARAAEGGTAAMEALIDLAVEETNTAFANSLIAPRLRLVHMAEVDYTESGDMSTDLSRVRGKTDGFMDEVHAWRDAYAADQVSLIESTGNYCGIAYLMSSVGSYFESSAFSVVHRSCATGNYTFGHEWGHNAGSHHDRANSGSSPAYPYSYGYQAPDTGFRTVMSYNCSGGCPRIQHFSNPDVLYGGQPTGIDYDIDPTNSADNARSINNIAYTMANFRVSGTGPTEPPGDPSGLSANPISASGIDLTWNDNSDNETGFELERSLDGTSWQLIATLGTNVVAYADSSLSPSTTYHYRVRSFNSLGNSNYTNGAQATTEAPPPYLETVAGSEILGDGTVSGTYVSTHTQNGGYQSITERTSGGKPADRYSYLQHTWEFNVPAGNVITFSVDGYAEPSQDGDSFVFAYSTDGANYFDMLTLLKTNSGDDSYQSYVLPDTTQGQVFIRVTDSDRTAGNKGLDAVHVDHLLIVTETSEGDPPSPPSGLGSTEVSASQVGITWLDNSGDETGFEIQRSLAGGPWSVIGSVGVDTIVYTDDEVTPNTTYEYRVKAFNASGPSPYSETLMVETPDGLVLSASGYKLKGVQHADLDWGKFAVVDIYRNGTLIAESVADSFYTDNIGSKGGGTYEYFVCPENLVSGCSNTASVVF